MSEFDLVIRGGTVVDGTGGAPRTADVATRDGRIVAVGRVDGRGDRETDAAGALVTPGFVDIHTHYDGQATWDSRLWPSSQLGVTTVVMGNCGVGFAPVFPHHHDRLIELMEGVEDIPGTALHEGLSWKWESFGQYLDALDGRPHDIDFAAQVPHTAVRLFVMGEEGANHENRATPEQIEAMGRVVRDAIGAGAIGFATSRTRNHRSSKGEPIPTLTAAREELVGIAAEMGRGGAGVLQVVSDLVDFDSEFGTFREMAAVSGLALSISVATNAQRANGHRRILAALAEANAEGLTMRGQVGTRGVGVLLGLQGSLHPWMRCPIYRNGLAALPLAERVARMRLPEVRAQILREESEFGLALAQATERIFPMSDPPDYEPAPETSMAATAARQGVPAMALIYDLLLEQDGKAFLYAPILNYVAEVGLEPVREMLLDPNTVPALGDGGAHVGLICDGSFPLTLLTHWCRDRSRGARLDVPFAIKAQCRDTAVAVGLLDRGVLAPGYRADVNVLDFERLQLRAPSMAFDLPAGGKRLLQRAEGILHTFVAGQETYRDGVPTEALPGRLVRGAQQAPATMG